MRNKWIRKVLYLCVMLVVIMVLGPASPALAAPVTTISLSGTLGENDFYISDVTVTLEATDNVSGVNRIEYSFDNWSTTLTYSSPFTITDEGYYRVWAMAWDNEGHMEPDSPSREVKIDKTPPVTTFVFNGQMGDDGWWLSDVNVTLAAADNVSTTGTTPIQYSLNGGNSWLDYSGVPLTIIDEGTTTVLAKVRNNAGIEESPPVSSTIKIDKTAPVTTISLNGTLADDSSYTSNVTVTLSATDNTSGVATTEYSLNDGGSWQTYNAPFTVSTLGTTTALARTSDNAGNLESPPVSVTFNLASGAEVTSFGTATLYVGLTNSDDINTTFNVKLDVYRDRGGTLTLVGSGNATLTPVGGGGFVASNVVSITPALIPGISCLSNDILTAQVLVKTGTGSVHTGAKARLWYDGVNTSAGSHSSFDITLGSSTTYFLRLSNALSTTPGATPNNSVSTSASTTVSTYLSLGTWSITLP